MHVRNIRNTTYRSTTDYTPAYYDKTFDLDKLTSVWYIVEPFSNWKGAAHTFLSFGFEDDEYLAISVEIRKEEGEGFSAFKGLFKQYEVIYVIADERDVITVRTNHRRDDVPHRRSTSISSRRCGISSNRSRTGRERPTRF